MTESHSQIDRSKGPETVDVEKARRGTRLLLEAVGEDPDSDTLTETWQRRVPETIATLTEGSRDEEKPTFRMFEANNDELIVKTGIPLYSLCEHHMLPYHGVAHVAYRPGDRVVGLSKLPRYVRWQARQLTMQEELTNDIAAGLTAEIGASAVLVEITATHLCEAMRGVETATETTSWAETGEPTETDRKRFRDAINKYD
jgi:GTP cyclohydrolase I